MVSILSYVVFTFTVKTGKAIPEITFSFLRLSKSTCKNPPALREQVKNRLPILLFGFLVAQLLRNQPAICWSQLHLNLKNDVQMRQLHFFFLDCLLFQVQILFYFTKHWSRRFVFSNFSQIYYLSKITVALQTASSTLGIIYYLHL